MTSAELTGIEVECDEDCVSHADEQGRLVECWELVLAARVDGKGD